MIRKFSEDYLEGMVEVSTRINDLVIKLGERKIGILDFPVLVSDELLHIANEVKLTRDIIKVQKETREQ